MVVALLQPLRGDVVAAAVVVVVVVVVVERRGCWDRKCGHSRTLMMAIAGGDVSALEVGVGSAPSQRRGVVQH